MRRVLKSYITEQSKGRIKLELSELDLNLFLNRLQIREADLVSTDTINEAVTYHVTFRKLTLRVASVWDLLFNKKLLLDSITLHDPVIEVMQWKKDTAHVRVKDELSIPQEMGKVYHSMIHALNEFGIKRIIINNASIRLINKLKPRSEPVTISNIFFTLDDYNPYTGKVTKEQTVELKTTNQDIALPGGRHRLAFKSFKLQLFNERIEFDSCTVTAVATDSTRSNYRIFFKKLFLSGVDFSAMSMQNVIRADSVYCQDPYFNFDLYKSIAAKKKTEMPDVQKIIRELSGNLDLAFVGIKNAGIHFNIHGKANRSFYNSNKDNFEMREFRINPDSSEPVSIKRFEMTLRDYQLYNADSSTSYSFDSLQLLNSQIALSNFSISSQSGRNKIRNDIDIKVPYFQLTELDWYQLIFDQKMVATEASLNNPIISYKRNTKATRSKKFNLFSALENIDSLVELNTIHITNGDVNMELKGGTSFHVQNLDLGLQSNRFLSSTNKTSLRRALDHLSFSNGMLHLKNITAKFGNTRFTGSNQLYTDKISITSKNNSISGTASNVHINNLLLDDDQETMELDGLQWEKANITVNAIPPAGKKNNNDIHFSNIEGKNSRLHFSKGPMVISTFVNVINAASLIKKENEPLRVEGFYISGNDLTVKHKTLILYGNDYSISNSPSYIRGLNVQQVKGRDSFLIQSPEVRFSANLNSLFANDIHLADLQATSPDIIIHKWDLAFKNETVEKRSVIRIDKLTTTEPEIKIDLHRHDSVTEINIPRNSNSIVNASGIIISPESSQLENLVLKSSAATFIKTTGEKMGIEKGSVDLDISNIYVGNKNERSTWRVFVNTFSIRDSAGLQIGNKTNLKFSQASLGNLSLSSDYVPGFNKLIKTSVSAWMRIPEGVYTDSNTTFKWYNAAYDNNKRVLQLDSLEYHPTLPQDTLLAHAPYQFDYTTLNTGAVTITGLKAEQYETDSSFIADTVTIKNPYLTVSRDKLPPHSPHKKDKPLPVDLIKNIVLPVAVKNITFDNGSIIYAERNAKSRQEGVLALTGLNGSLGNIKNHNLEKNDSLWLQLNGFLMDSAHLDISVKQSYTDSLSGFLLHLGISPAPLNILNPLIVPLSNVKVTSGILDSLTMDVVGRNDMALGTMNMYYHDLRIKLIKEGDPDQTTFIKNVISFLANTFVIKDNNTSRTGVVFYERLTTQSFPKYLLKMTLSGAGTSIGSKKNRKYVKAYEEALKRSGLPGLK